MSEKMAFITCVNKNAVYEECLFYLKHLNIPKDMEIEFIPVHNAESMAAGYNQAMKSSDAKYKVYLHQDVFILNRNFIQDCIKCFESNQEIGMLGVLGSDIHVPSGDYLKRWNVGKTYACNAGFAVAIYEAFSQESYCEVEAIDGMLMVTQTDICWREDVFKDFDFYDLSQSMEFLKKGYKVAIPPMNDHWCMHDCGKSKRKNFEKNRKLFCNEYRQMGYSYEENEYNSLAGQMEDKIQQFLITIDALIQNASYEQAFSFAHELYMNSCTYTEIVLLNNLYEIYNAEKSVRGGFCSNKYSIRDLIDAYTEVKFVLRRLGNHMMDPESAREYFRARHISREAINVIIRHSLLESEALAVKEAMKR